MSTILDALKRLEDERRDENKAQTPSSMSGHDFSRFSLSRRVTVLLFTVLVLMGGAATLIWINVGFSEKALSRSAIHYDPKSVAPNPETNKGAPLTASTRSPRVANPIAAKQAVSDFFPVRMAPRGTSEVFTPSSRQKVLPTYSDQFKAQPIPKRSSRDKSTDAAPDFVSLALPPRGSFEKVARTGVAPPRKYSGEKTGEADAAGIAEEKPAPKEVDSIVSPPASVSGMRKSAEPPAPAAVDRYTDAELLARGTLQLQAISWSETPSSRLTVVDGRILREGQSADGYTVIQIRPEDVILGKDGKRWRLAYDNQ